MRYPILLLLGLALSGSPALAQEDAAQFSIGSDYFAAGNAPTHSTSGADDVFLAGQNARLESPITGNVHLIGQYLTVNEAVGGDTYAAGMEINLSAPVAGDASLAGATIRLNDTVGGDLRAAGQDITLDAPVAGYALIAGQNATLNSTVEGDVSLAVEAVTFGPDASIGGTLTIYEEEIGRLDVPERVIAPNRITRKEIEMAEYDGMPQVFSWRRAIWSFVKGVIVVAFLAAVIAAIAPDRLASLRRSILDAPFRSLWIGFLAQSMLIGATVLLAMTIIGLAIAPVTIVLALTGGFVGYVIAAYALGVGLMMAIGRGEPASLGERAIAGGVGALVAAVIALIPMLGWLFVLAAVLAGIGALTQHLFRPAFFSGPGQY